MANITLKYLNKLLCNTVTFSLYTIFTGQDESDIRRFPIVVWRNYENLNWVLDSL